MTRQSIKETIIIAVAYWVFVLCMAANAWHDAQTNAHANKMLVVHIVLVGISSFFPALSVVWALPPQFTPLHRLSWFGKIWRIVIAALAILMGGTVTLVGLFRIWQQPSASSLAFITLFAAMLYVGIRMLRAR